MGTRRKWRSRSAWTFFGLNHNYIEAVYEQLFAMKYHGGWSFFEAYNLPVNIRMWMIERLVKQKEEEASAAKGATPTSTKGFSYKP